MYVLSFEEGTTLLWQKRDLQGESRPKFQNKTRWFLTIGLSGAERGILGWSSWKKRSRREGKLEENLVKSTSLKVLGLRASMRKRYRPCSGAWSRRDERGRQGISSEGDGFPSTSMNCSVMKICSEKLSAGGFVIVQIL